MKRFFCLLFAAIVTIALCSCGQGQGGSETNSGYGEIKELDLGEDTRMVVFGSDEASFCVTSTLIIRNKKALLIDTKFTKTDAEEIIRYIQDKKLELVDVFVSHGDPDYYFGLEEIKAQFPRVIARNTPATAERITSTVLSKLVAWAGVLGDQVPENIVVPKVFSEPSFSFEGLEIQIYGSDPARITLYLPQHNVFVGGTNVYSGYHLFLADQSSDEARGRWLANLRELRAQNAALLVPGHSDLSLESFDNQGIDFSIEYLETAQTVLDRVETSGDFVRQMQEAYPNLKGLDVLELSGKVLTGEMEWE